MNVIKELYDIIEEKLSEIKLSEIQTLFVILIVIFMGILASDGFLQQYISSLKIRSIIYLIFITSWGIFWFLNRFRLPRNKKGKVGIVIAIFSEEEKERKMLKGNFISKLKKDFQREGISDFSEIIVLKNHFSKQIVESVDLRKELERINKKIKAHLYIWGDIKKRPDGDEGEKYFMTWGGYVVHNPIAQELSNALAKDFAKVLPPKMEFLENRSFRELEASADRVNLTIKYIVGFAALISQDPKLALKLHSKLREQINAIPLLPPELMDIKKRLPLLISDELLWIARWYFNNKQSDKAKELIKESLKENPKNYGTWLFKAVLDFLVDKDVLEAFKSAKVAEQYSKGTHEWKYSLGFLYFWTENYWEALKICHSIRNQSYYGEEHTLQEVREFNLNLLKEPGAKNQLYFWIGYLSYFKTKKLCSALEDLENFEKFADRKMSVLKQKSSAYLQEIKKEMGDIQ